MASTHRSRVRTNDDEPVNKWKELVICHNNGERKYSMMFLNNNQHGKTTEYSRDGQVVSIKMYEYGNLEGKREQYDKNDKLLYTHTYVKNVLHGESIFYYPTGKIMRVDLYIDGLLHGDNKSYYPDGGPKCFKTYNKGKLNGCTFWYYNGVYKSVEVKEESMTYTINEENIKSTENKLMSVCYHDNGVLHGKTKFYDKYGRVYRFTTYLYGKQHGEYQRLYRGKIILLHTYVHGELRMSKMNYPDGTPMCIHTWHDGHPHGKSKYYYPDGRLKKIVVYEHGKIVG